MRPTDTGNVWQTRCSYCSVSHPLIMRRICVRKATSVYEYDAKNPVNGVISSIFVKAAEILKAFLS